MPAAPETAESSGRASLQISLKAREAGPEDVRRLFQWLAQDPELAAEPVTSRISVELRQRPPDEDESMGATEDILVWLSTIFPVQPIIFGLLRSLYNHTQNRRDPTTEVTVVVTDGLELTLRASERQSRAELEEKARQAAAAIRPDGDDPE